MKTPEGIKKALQCRSNLWYCVLHDCAYYNDKIPMCSQNVARDALSYIQQLEHNIGELTEKIMQLGKERNALLVDSKWISVKEKLPENDDNYLVFTSDKNEVEIATYYGDGEWLTHDLTNLTPFVTHWMPLPKEEVKNERFD